METSGIVSLDDIDKRFGEIKKEYVSLWCESDCPRRSVCRDKRGLYLRLERLASQASLTWRVLLCSLLGKVHSKFDLSD